MKYSFHPEALEEYLDAVSFYAKINSRLAESFIKAIEKGFEDILSYPQAWQIVKEDIRRHLVKRFPFGIYYSVESDSILIYAIMHMSRHPDYWKTRID